MPTRSNKVRLGLTGRLMTLLLLTCCAPMKLGTSTSQTPHKHYTDAQSEAIVRDERSCGPAAKQALFDWAVSIQ